MGSKRAAKAGATTKKERKNSRAGKTEELLELVLKYPVLYDSNDEDYKDMGKRDAVFEKIGEELQQSADDTKKQWKNLRDAYIKYLKSTSALSATSTRYRSWMWADKMEVFKPYIVFTPRNRRTPVSFQADVKEEEDDDEDEDEEDEEEEAISNGYNSESSPVESLDPLEDFSVTPTIRVLPLPASTDKKKRKKEEERGQRRSTEEAAGLESKKFIGDLDATELVFLGFAKTVKTFSPLVQARLKVKIAELLLDQEIEFTEAALPNSH